MALSVQNRRKARSREKEAKITFLLNLHVSSSWWHQKNDLLSVFWISHFCFSKTFPCWFITLLHYLCQRSDNIVALVRTLWIKWVCIAYLHTYVKTQMRYRIVTVFCMLSRVEAHQYDNVQFFATLLLIEYYGLLLAVSTITYHQWFFS